MSDADLVRQYAGAYLPMTHPARPALERAAADGLCVLTWHASGVLRVHAAWAWPTRKTQSARFKYIGESIGYFASSNVVREVNAAFKCRACGASLLDAQLAAHQCDEYGPIVWP